MSANAPLPPAGSPPTPAGASMSFMDHLMELRARIILSLLAVAGMMVLALIFYQQIFDFLMAPLLALTFEVTAPDGRLVKAHVELLAQAPTDGFFMAVRLGLFGGLVLASPLLVYELWGFVSPGLYAHERRAVLPVFFAGLVFFLLGAATAYGFVLTRALRFLYYFNCQMGLKLTTFPTDYLSFVLALMLGFGIAFEMPLVLLALMRLGLLRPETLIRQWRYAVLIAFILGAVLTPPDLPSQLIMASVLLLFYAGSILFAKLTFARKPPAAPTTETEPADPDADPFAVYRHAGDESKPEAP